MLRWTVEALKRDRRTRRTLDRLARSRFIPKTSYGWVWLGMAVGAAVAVGLYLAWKELPRHPGVTVSQPGDEEPPAALTSVEEKALLDQHRPVLHFAPGEYWAPSPISLFIREAEVEHWTKKSGWTRPRKLNPPTEETLPRGDDYRLNERICKASRGPRCYEKFAGLLSRAPIVTYGRVWRNDTGGDRDVGYVLQYWLFYYFDDWRNERVDPTIWQIHEGDWEVVNVALNRCKSPIYAAYSEHKEGLRRPWSAVHAPGERPHVYVGLGSHANFFRPGVHPTQKQWLPALARPFVDKYHLHDVAGAEPPVDPTVVLLTPDTPWLSFEGPWGEREQLLWINARGQQRHKQLGRGPTGPVEKQLLWDDPVVPTRRWPLDPTFKTSRRPPSTDCPTGPSD